MSKKEITVVHIALNGGQGAYRRGEVKQTSIKRKMKKKKIASYGSRFDGEMSEIRRFGCLGMEERRDRKGAAQGFLENVIFIEQDAW